MKGRKIGVCIFVVIGIGVLIAIGGLNYGKQSSIIRSFQKTTLEPGEIITVTLDVVIGKNETYYAIEEYIPSGWIVIDNNGGATSDQNKLAWVVLQDAQDTTYTYNVQAPSQVGSYDFDGIYMFENFNEPKTNKGDTVVNVVS